MTPKNLERGPTNKNGRQGACKVAGQTWRSGCGAFLKSHLQLRVYKSLKPSDCTPTHPPAASVDDLDDLGWLGRRKTARPRRTRNVNPAPQIGCLSYSKVIKATCSCKVLLYVLPHPPKCLLAASTAPVLNEIRFLSGSSTFLLHMRPTFLNY
jgi:hypothetical protein